MQSVTRAEPITRPEDRDGQTRYWLFTLVGFIGIGLYLLMFNLVTMRTDYNIWAGFVYAPVLFLIGSLFLRSMLKKVEPDLWIRRVIIVGLAAKLVGGIVRYGANEYFLGQGDAENYHEIAQALVPELRSFTVGGPAWMEYLPDLTGTRFINLFTGIVYSISGPTFLGGMVIFSFMSFWGLYLWYRAYRIAMPDGLHRRYVVLIFFLPSVVFWPSSIGKEAWMTTMLGLGSYGLARLLTHQKGAYVAILSAIAGMGIVRPHVAAIFGAALGAAFLLRRTRTGKGGGTTRKILGLLLLAIVAGVLMNQLQSFFDLDSGLDAQQVFDETGRRSGQGGSQFEGAQPTSPAQIPWAVVTVLFRPFLFEGLGNPAVMVTALEGTVLLALFLWNLPRLARLPAMMITRPYVGYALVYTMIFVFAFSAINNFGILARQRTQLYPIAVVVLTVPYQGALRTRQNAQASRDGTARVAPFEYAAGDEDDDDDDRPPTRSAAVGGPVRVGRHRATGRSDHQARDSTKRGRGRGMGRDRGAGRPSRLVVGREVSARQPVRSPCDGLATGTTVRPKRPR